MKIFLALWMLIVLGLCFMLLLLKYEYNSALDIWQPTDHKYIYQRTIINHDQNYPAAAGPGGTHGH